MASKQINHQTEIVVVGAGLVGLSAVIAYAQLGKRVMLVDAKPVFKPVNKTPQQYDTRVYAITPSTQQWLEALGVWQYLKKERVNDIEEMLLWHPAPNQPLSLAAADARLTSLGCIVENQNLMQALWQQIDTLAIPTMLGSACQQISIGTDAVSLGLANGDNISASLMVAADGVQSFVRQQVGIATQEKDFQQTAIVANFHIEQHHQHKARQWFGKHETLALLPLPDGQVSMVWSLSTKLATKLLLLSGEALTEQVQAAARDAKLGCLTIASEVRSFPLKQVTATALAVNRVALVGDAAHQVHPMAGQGANLGFRDIMMLARNLADAHQLADIGEMAFLRVYERNRKADVLSMNQLTSGLDQLFANDSPLLSKTTAKSFDWLNEQTFLKRLLIQQAVA